MKKLLLVLLSVSAFFAISACQNNDTAKQSEKPKNTPQKQEEKTISKDVSFYFPDEAVMYLCPETLVVNTRETEFLETIVHTLINGPVDPNLNPAISGKVNVLSATVKDKICTVDLSEEFATYNTGGTTKETMALYSIVNTLCGIDGIEKVKINIDGNENPDFGGHFDLSEPLEADLSLIND
jgi:germination protein M